MLTATRNALLFVFQVAALVFLTKSFAFATNFIPSESMVPTLEVGDRIVVTRWPYGYSRHSLLVDPGFAFPGPDGRVAGRLPERGDIVVFTRPRDGETLVKRVIGLPGDRIALDGGRLYLNGERVARKDRGTYAYRDANGIVIRVHRYDEVLPGGRTHAIIERTDSGMADTMAEMTVPEGQLFVLGDNRDNSLDSRFEETGLVPVENLQGRADLVGWSFYTCKAEQGLACAKARFLTMLQ
ncbi:MAG: signal peptidase I [Notoacmeibacter sp.]|nr:signal peptidase I [Notoacmeibacter sp.]MCC0032433.1 signal peptidase I [Brucellaceae bacterium]